MTVEKDKADPAGGRTPAPKTIVGVPAIPPERPSDVAMTREIPPQPAPPDDEAPTVARPSVSSFDAERLLEPSSWSAPPPPMAAPPEPTPPPAMSAPKPPAVAGALSKPATLAGGIRPGGVGGDMFSDLPPQSGRMPTERPTRAGVAPLPGTATRGRSTLLLDSSVPAPTAQRDEHPSERPPIVVPASGASTPKAVTQPPPWGQGAAQVAPFFPKDAPAPRAPEPSVEEISSSMLLPVDGADNSQTAGVEELSGSLLVEDAPGAPGGIVAKPLVHSPVVPAGRAPSVKPPVPSSVRPAPAGHRTMLGMPDLPKATLAPKLDFLPASSPPPPVGPTGTMPLAGADPTPSFLALAEVPAQPLSEGARAPVVPLAPGEVPPPPAELMALAPVEQELPRPPSQEPVAGDIELTQLPRSGLSAQLSAILARAPAIAAGARKALARAVELVRPAVEAVRASPLLRAGRRPPWFLPAVGAGGLVVGIGLVGLIVKVARGDHRSGADESSAAASASAPLPVASASAASTPSVAESGAAAPSPPPVTPCVVAGSPHVLAPTATLAAGVEVALLGPADVAVGFAPTDHDAIVMRLDPESLGAGTPVKAKSRDIIRRVTPILGARGALAASVDTDHKGDRLQGRRTVATTPPMQLGGADGHLEWAHVGGGPAGKLWPIDDTGVDAVRGAVDPASPSIAVAFRRSNAVWLGSVSTAGPTAAVGALARVDGAGTAVGSPAVAMSGGAAVAAWADRASSDAPWQLRWTRFEAGGAPDAPMTFTPPRGDHTSQTMSPGIAPLPGGGFLLVWTEGPAAAHAVRAVTLSHDGSAVGAGLAISSDGVNAGQGQAAVTSSGHGVVAFLESRGSAYQVVATPITCGK